MNATFSTLWTATQVAANQPVRTRKYSKVDKFTSRSEYTWCVYTSLAKCLPPQRRFAAWMWDKSSHRILPKTRRLLNSNVTRQCSSRLEKTFLSIVSDRHSVVIDGVINKGSSAESVLKFVNLKVSRWLAKEKLLQYFNSDLRCIPTTP